MMNRMFLTSLAVLAMACGVPAHAADFPSKPITIIVPFAAGGPTDTVARLLGQAMGVDLKQTVIVENVAGAGGTVGAGRAARSDPDGYTLFLHHIGHSTAPALYRKLPYNTVNDFEPIGLVTDVPMTLVARGNFPPKDLKELVAYVKTNKDKVTYANAGLGAASHLCGMLFMTAIDTDLTTVPYKGTGPAMNDLLGGKVDFMCDQTTNTTSQIKAGKIKVYARDHAEARALVAGCADGRRSRAPQFRSHRVAWSVCTEGYTEAGHRQARRGAQGGVEGSDAEAALRRPGHGAGGRQPRDTRSAQARTSRRRSSVGADHQESGRLRRLNRQRTRDDRKRRPGSPALLFDAPRSRRADPFATVRR